MPFRPSPPLALFFVTAVAAAPLSAGETDLNGKRFAVADGFTLEVAAGPPLVERPIHVDFDDRGRLYVAESSGSNDPVREQLEEKPHRILRLEDADGDGAFDRRTVFADRMMFPEGCCWHDGSLYVAAPPQIWRLTDADDDGVAERREVWFDGGTLTGCANDLHGPYAGPDGLLYWCKGAFAEQTHARPDEPPFVTRASHVFRHDPTTGAVEPVLTGGMDNPVEVAFSRAGERFLSATFLQHPAGGRRDGLIHAVYGGVYGKDHGVLAGHPRTGGLLPPLVHLGAAAPAGLARPEWDAAGGETLVAALFNLRKVTRHVLRPDGATFGTADDDLLSCDDVDFHPTDVAEDADGSLLVVDTGGWYKLCCPTSQLDKPDVPGAIYRLRGGRRPVDDPRGLRLDWDDPSAADLAARLGDPRPAVRRRAVSTLAKRGPTAVATLADAITPQASPEVRRLAVWTLARIDDPAARVALRPALADADPAVRRSAAHAAGLWRDGGAVGPLRRLLRSGTPAERRAAAEALGRVGDAAAVPDLLAAAAGADRVLHHSVTFALIEVAAPSATRAGLTAESADSRRAALLALAQMKGGDLRPADVTGLLASPDADLREAAVATLELRPEWGDATAEAIGERLGRAEDADVPELGRLLARLADRPAVRALIGRVLADERFPGAARRAALRAVADAPLSSLPADWVAGLVRAVASQDEEAVAAAVAAVAAKGEGGIDPEIRRSLHSVAATEGFGDPLRLAALRAAREGRPPADAAFRYVLSRLGRDVPVGVRLAAADALAAAPLTAEQLGAVAAALPSLGPLELDRLLPAFGRAKDDATGLALVAGLQKSEAAADLPSERIAAAVGGYGEAVREAARPLTERVTADAEDRRRRLDELLADLPAGDPRRGQTVFRSDRAACAACHAIGYLGGRVGPDLTGIGKIRTDRDLLESIVFPNASFVRSFEPVTVVTVDGAVHGGVVVDDGPDAVTLATGVDKTVRLRRDVIEELRPSSVSVMPAGLDRQLSPGELADLIAFLRVAR